MYAGGIILSMIVCSVAGQGMATAADFETQAIYDTMNSPASRLAIVIGHTVAAIPRSLVILAITIPVLLLGTETLPAGNIAVLGLILLLTILALVPIGELIGIRTKQREQAILFSVLFAVVGFLAGGGLAPIGLMPTEMRAIVLLLPTTHSIAMWTRVFFQDTMLGLLPGAVSLLAVWILLSLLTAQLLKREVEHA